MNGIKMSNNSQTAESCDIDGPGFNPKAYIDKLLNEKDLSDLLAKETEIVEQIRSLDSEMQTLVYDNYNRFICATDTIKMMKTDFTTVETEMNSLASKISDLKITANDIKHVLQENREELKNLSATQESLVKLQYLFDLPKTLRECLEQKNLAKAVSHYKRGKSILNTHSESPGLQGIRTECETVMEEIYQICMETFKKSSNPKQAYKLMLLLIRMNIPTSELYSLYLNSMSCQIDATFSRSSENLDFDSWSHSITMLHDHSNNVIKLFLAPENEKSNNISRKDMVDRLVQRICHFLNIIFRTIDDSFNTSSSVDIPVLAKQVIILYSLVDEFFETLQAFASTETDLIRYAFTEPILSWTSSIKQSQLQIMFRVARLCGSQSLARLKKMSLEKLEILKKQLSQHLFSQQQKHQAQKQSLNPFGESVDSGEFSLLASYQDLSRTLATSIRSSLETLKIFLDPSKSYTANVDFHVEFCVDVCREGLIVAFLEFLTDTALTMTRFPQMTTSCPELCIIFGKMFYEWAVTGTVGHLFAIIDDIILPKTSNSAALAQFVHPSLMQAGSRKLINARIAKFPKPLSLSGPISERLKEVALKLLTSAARQKGDQIGALLQKSIDTRDWLKSAEPRSVRSVIKRVLDVEISAFSINMTYLFGQDQQDVGKGKQELSASFNFPTSGQMPTQLRHLFSGHKLDFGESVTPCKDSIVVAAVKTALKTLVECVRLKSFSKYGLQQMQIDCHCLKVNLDNLIMDSAAAHILLEEALLSAERRCVEAPQLLEERALNAIIYRQ